jgi:hypothetical protein
LDCHRTSNRAIHELVSARRLNTVYLADVFADITLLLVQVQPRNCASTGRALVCRCWSTDCDGLGHVTDLVDGAQVESGSASNVEEVVSQDVEMQAKLGEVAAGHWRTDDRGGDSMKKCYVGVGEGGGIVEGCDCTEGYGDRGGGCAGVVLNTASNCDILQCQVGGWELCCT